jgi:hypothetical protein
MMKEINKQTNVWCSYSIKGRNSDI